MPHDQHIKRFKYEKLFKEMPLTDQKQYQAEYQIKNQKIARRIGAEDSRWPDKNRGQ